MSEAPRPTPRKRKLTSPVWNDFERIKNEDGSCIARCRHCSKQMNASSRTGTSNLRKHLEACQPFKQLKTVRHRRLTSAVWNHYDREKNEDGTFIARCNHCKKSLNGDSKSGTTHLRKHLEACHAFKFSQDNLPKGQQALKLGDLNNDKAIISSPIFEQSPENLDYQGEGTPEIGDANKDHEVMSIPETFKFNQDVSRLDLARMIILHGYPFSIVQQVGFRTFLENLQPYFKIMSRNTVKADCMKIFENEKQKLFQVFSKLPSRVSLTVDFWGSGKDLDYIRLTGHFIDDDWRLQKRVLNFCALDDPQVMVAKTILEKLFEWNIDRKVLSIVMESPSTNEEAVQEITNILDSNGSLFMDGDFFRVQNCAHIVKLLVQDGMEGVNEVVDKVRESVKFVKSSVARQQRFKDLVKQVGASEKSLVLDDPSRWDLTFLMIETAFASKEAFSGLAACDGEFVNAPNAKDWEILKTVHSCLKAFYDVMHVFSSAKLTTANICFAEVCCIYLFLKEWCSSSDSMIASMALKMVEKFDRYWAANHLILAVAAILDPRLKMKPIEYYFPMIYNSEESKEKLAGICVGLTKLYNEYVARSTSICQGLPWTGGNSCGVSDECVVNGVSEDIPLSISSIDRRRGLEKFLQEASSNQRVKTDLDMYLEEPVYPVQNGLHAENFDILSWWKLNAPKYPVVAEMARDILSIPACTVTADVAFSSESRILDPYRSSMLPNTLEGLMCAQDWLRNEIKESLPGSSGSSLQLSTLMTCIAFDGEVDACNVMSDDGEFSPST